MRVCVCVCGGGGGDNQVRLLFINELNRTIAVQLSSTLLRCSHFAGGRRAKSPFSICILRDLAVGLVTLPDIWGSLTYRGA